MPFKKSRNRNEEIHQQGEDTLRQAGYPGTDPDTLRKVLETEKSRLAKSRVTKR